MQVFYRRAVRRLHCDYWERVRRGPTGAAVHHPAQDHADPLLFSLSCQHQLFQQRQHLSSCEPDHTTARRRAQSALIFILVSLFQTCIALIWSQVYLTSTGMEDGELKVTVHNKTSFTIYWNSDIIKEYVCYSAEWREERNKVVNKSFFLKGSNKTTFTSLEGV